MNLRRPNKYVGIKSATHYRAYFQPRAKACIPTNPPGVHTANYACLDFKNVILLSCNEDMLPKNVHRASLIPYNLREFYGMTTMEKPIMQKMALSKRSRTPP